MRDVQLHIFAPPPRKRRRSKRVLYVLGALGVVVAAVVGFILSPLGGNAAADARPSQAEGLTFWSSGDSTSYYMSVAMTEALVERGAVPLQAEPEYENGSGLRSVDYFDWETYIRDNVATQGPDMVFFMIGANDATDGIDLRAYRAQVAGIMDSLARVRYVVWIGQPTMADPARAAIVADLNDIFRSEASKRPWVRYVDAVSVTDGETGQYAQFLLDDSGEEIRAREDDGLHFTPQGGALLARHVLTELFD